MILKSIERRVRIVSVQLTNEQIILQFQSPFMEMPKMPRFEDVIMEEPKTEEEKLAVRMTKAYVEELEKRGYSPFRRSQVPRPAPLRIELTKDEYEKLGKPTVDEYLTLKLEYE